jgi:hypothetical protein
MWTFAGNQEVAEQIAANLKDSGQMRGYKIGVKYQDGTAWLKGQVTDREQMDNALKLVFKTPGVTRVVNNLTIASKDVATETRAVAKDTEAIQTSSIEPILKIAPAKEEGPSLQQASGAIAAEQRNRPVVQEMRKPQIEASAVVVQPERSSIQERLVSNFTPAEARDINVIALQEPTVAPSAASKSTARSKAVQTMPVEAPVAQSTPAPMAMPVQAIAQQPTVPQTVAPRSAKPLAMAYMRTAQNTPLPIGAQPNVQQQQQAGPIPAGNSAVRYDHPNVPCYAWPTYAAHPNYAAVTYPKQYSPTCWPYIGPFYPYPQVPLGWRKVTLEWHDGWWNLDFDDGSAKGPYSGLFRPCRH